MKIIIPMAGMGKRMRPHTLTIPKPLLKIAGKPIVQRLVETLAKSTTEKIDEIAFIIGNFGQEVEKSLIGIAEQVGAKGSIYYQHEALGTAHAIYCAKQSLEGKVTIAFADTLFHSDVVINHSSEGIIWVKKVEDPSQFGVVLTDNENNITGFVEKPKDLVSDMAIIGIYFFKDGLDLKNEIAYLIDNNIIKNGEYQLTDVLQTMLSKGKTFIPQEVDEWLDCGNKNATVYTNRRILEYSKTEKLINKTAVVTNSIIIPPCYIGENAYIINSIIGPHVSIGKNTKIENAIITDSIIQDHSTLVNANIDNSMVGNYVEYKETYKELNIGDYTEIF
jgi:glucose-1-phosphate thymidylyltransferase